MIMKNLSNKDVMLIKRALKYIVKHEDLLNEHITRAEWLLKDLDEDESVTFYVSMISTMYEKNMFDNLKKGYEQIIKQGAKIKWLNTQT